MKVYHYPKCSTSSAALAFLRSCNINPEVILYCEKGLNKAEIADLMHLLGTQKPINLIKKNGIMYRNLGLAHKNLLDADLMEVICQTPKLLQRPIIISGNKAIIGKNTDVIRDFIALCQQ